VICYKYKLLLLKQWHLVKKLIRKVVNIINRKVQKMQETVILVDKDDSEIGLEEKMKAHEQGKLHRAFSVFIFNSKGEMMLQQRADKKYHSGGLWTNACCSHPRAREEVEQAAHRRLKEEMGFDCDIKKIFDFIYKANLDHGLTEHELDHVFIGSYNGEVNLNSDEAKGYKWISVEDLKIDMQKNPTMYTEWFKIALNEVFKSHLFSRV